MWELRGLWFGSGVGHLSRPLRHTQPDHPSVCIGAMTRPTGFRPPLWFSWKHKLLSAARFEPGPSRAAGKRATTRPLRPMFWPRNLRNRKCSRSFLTSHYRSCVPSLESVLSNMLVPLHGTHCPNTSALNLTLVFLGNCWGRIFLT